MSPHPAAHFVKLIVPQTPGCATDVFARKIAAMLSDKWGQRGRHAQLNQA